MFRVIQLPEIPANMSRVASVFIVIAALFFSSVSAQACWTTVGSTGTVVRGADNALVTGQDVRIRSNVASGEVEVRYNVVAVRGIFGGDRQTKTMVARLADNGDNAQVTITFRELNLATGGFKTIGFLDSNNFPSHFQARERAVQFNCQKPELDFSKHVYYVIVKLVKTGSGGNPIIRGFRICGNGIC